MTDSALADHAGNDRSSRRALLGAAVGGAAIALAGGRSVAAATPAGLSDEDLSISGSAIALELAARDLYDSAIAAGADDEIWTAMREQHESYAQRLAGITGISATTRDQESFDQLGDGFATSDPAAAAFDLENTLAATHLELLGQVADVDIAKAMASFVAIESRHATVLATLSGQADDFDALFVNPAVAVVAEA
ncbi:MAG: ferritin-like domain-containing protein [Ilumatobacteraceae bacterium]|nr:ferritin-like domain-containing protein [Ilumatobacteraceae bacterium]